MAESGQENGQSATVAVLHEVVAELRGLRADTNSRFESMDTRFESIEQVLRGQARQLGEVVAGVADLRAEVHEGFAELGEKIESAAARDRHLEEKIQ